MKPIRYLLPTLLMSTLCTTSFIATANVIQTSSLQKTPITAQPEPVNRIVAIVNKSVITQTALDKAVKEATLQAAASGLTLPDAQALQQQVLRHLIFQKAALQLAKLNHITVSDDEVDSAIASIADKNHATLAQLKETLNKSGLDFKNYRQTVKQQLIINKLEQQAVAGSILITPEDVDKYMQQLASQTNSNTLYHVQHILLPAPIDPTPADLDKLKTQATALLQKIQSGQLSFTKAAMTYSASSDALQGGDLGWKIRDQLPTLFAKRIATMSTGQVEGPILDSNGAHLFTLVATKQPTIKPTYVLEKDLQVLEMKATPVLTTEKVKALLEKLRAAAENGVDFGKLAKTNSQDTASANQQGKIGWINPNDLPAAYSAAVTTTKVGQISAPFAVDGTWRLIKVLAERKVDISKAIARNQARQDLINQKAQSALETWRSQLLGQSYIKVLDPDLQPTEFKKNGDI